LSFSETRTTQNPFFSSSRSRDRLKKDFLKTFDEKGRRRSTVQADKWVDWVSSASMWVGGWVGGANACQGSELVLGVSMMQKEFCAGSSHDGEYPRDRQCYSTQEDLYSLSNGTLQALP
jgi:hypothetical protein